MKKRDFLNLVLIYAAVRPTFYIYFWLFGRISDLSSLFLALIALIFGKKISFFKPYLFWLLLLETVILFSLFSNSFFFNLTFRDFLPLAFPFYLFVAFSLGIVFSEKNLNPISEMVKIIILIGSINLFLGAIQYFFPKEGKIFHLLYSTPKLLKISRPTGLSYTHIEYGALSLLLIFALLFKFLISPSGKCFFLILFASFLGLLSLSKGIVVFFFFFFLALYFFFLFLKNLRKNFFKPFFKVSIFLFGLILGFIFSSPYLYKGFSDLIKLNPENLSIGHRLEDIFQIKKWAFKDPLHFLFGYSPLRKYPKISYIEETFFNFLFRFGIFGLFLYYFFYLYPLAKLLKNLKNISKNKNLYLFSILFSSLIIGLLMTDFTINLSESVKFSFLVAVISGAIVNEIEKAKEK